MSVPPRGAALERIPVKQLSPPLYVKRFPASRRLDQLVLLDLAESSDYGDGRGTWGEHAFPSVPAIAARIGYCERSVQYALRRLEAERRLERVERAGRTTVYRIVRHLEVVVEEAPARGAAVAPGGARVAPDQGLPTRSPSPPEPPLPPKGSDEPPDGGAHAAPSARRPVSPTDPPSPAVPLALVEGPHRRMRGAGLPSDPGEPSAEGPDAALCEPQDAVRVPPRAMRCPTCHALPGRPCTRSGGTPRRRNHAARLELLAETEARQAAERRRPVPPCPEHGPIISRTPAGECGACRADRLAAGGGHEHMTFRDVVPMEPATLLNPG